MRGFYSSVWNFAAKILKNLQMSKFFYIFARFLLIRSMKSFVYSDSTIAFVTAAAQTCLLVEQTAEHDREEWREQMLRLLPVLYLRARLLEPAQTVMEEEPARFVTEEDYNFALVGIRNLLGSDDAYLDIFVDQGIYTDDIRTSYISEGLADIYQELKDLAAAFQTGEEPVMNDAVVLCREAFDNHWGRKLLSVMRALHEISDTSY